ncbi:hypothetical protein H072_7818 [Dactylellina haptotyla CBS 200.50]|uniref:Mid2 domain-containing protein n=1 Tax=Dactylellina haptotyla (strain CBS 200.50) TaxID=1284197 RepID=S8ABF4_DACHA|nr:hypothetical protein H072_7818 [Dactylellina haptotyla CBS 200.50]
MPHLLRNVVSLMFLAFALIRQSVAQRGEGIGFSDQTSFNALRACATCCFEGLGCGDTGVATALGCNANSCLCARTDILASAITYVSACVSSRCDGATEDISLAGMIFADHCNAYLGTTKVPTGVDSARTTDAGADQATVTLLRTVTETIPLRTITTTLETATIRETLEITATVTSLVATNTSDQFSRAGGLTQSEKVGVGVGVGLGVPLLALAIVFIYQWFQGGFMKPPEIPYSIQSYT